MDQTDSLMVLIPSKARDQGLPAQIPCCHLDLGPIPDLRPRDPSPPASLTSHHLPPLPPLLLPTVPNTFLPHED